MEKIIREMLEQADKTRNYELAVYAYRLLIEMCYTPDCPDEWQELGLKLAEEYDSSWIQKCWNEYEDSFIMCTDEY